MTKHPTGQVPPVCSFGVYVLIYLDSFLAFLYAEGKQLA